MSRMMEDPRIDPRFKAVFGGLTPFPLPNFDSRDALIAAMNAPEVLKGCARLSCSLRRKRRALRRLRG